MANMKLDKDSNDELQSWLSRTAWDRNTVVSYMIADFNSSLRHLKAVDDRLFEQGKTESERVMELLSEIQHKQISGFTLIFYLQKYMPRGEFLLKQEEGEV
jgi:hypothetical protein